MYVIKYKIERYERYNNIKYVNYFILFVLSFEALSLMLGSGTHYEHYKFRLMVLIILANLTFNILKKNINFEKAKKNNRS